MKSAYEIAMEKLEQSAPARKLTAEQLERIHEADSKYRARIAERETFLQSELAKARGKDDFAEAEMLEKQLHSELSILRKECEDMKQGIREEEEEEE